MAIRRNSESTEKIASKLAAQDHSIGGMKVNPRMNWLQGFSKVAFVMLGGSTKQIGTFDA